MRHLYIIYKNDRNIPDYLLVTNLYVTKLLFLNGPLNYNTPMVLSCYILFIKYK